MGDQFLHLIALGTASASAAHAIFSKTARALYKLQSVVIAPRLDRIFLDKVHRTDQLHALEILAVQLRHHRLNLAAVQHSHEDRLDHIIKMMPKRNFIAAQRFRLRIEVTASHSGTKVARILFDRRHRVENIALKYRQRNAEKFRIVLDDLPVIRIVARIHH